MTSVLVMKLWPLLSDGAICFDDRFCASKKGGIGEVGGFQHRVPCTWAAALAGCRKALVVTGLSVSLLQHGMSYTWQLPWLAVEKPWLVLALSISLLFETNGHR